MAARQGKGTGVPVPYLRAWRERRMWTQHDLSVAAGLAQGIVSRAERGLTVRSSTARKMAAALEIETPQLRYDDPDKVHAEAS